MGTQQPNVWLQAVLYLTKMYSMAMLNKTIGVL